MAIISCPECGKQISDRAASCPNCGCPISAAPVVPQIDSAKDISNLLALARSSFESKNYSQAEEFCNQAIAIDGTCFAAWKLKGEAINYQISANNQRILEAYNCVMKAYDVLGEAEKEDKKYEVLSSLKDLMEGEVTFWTKQFENDRPTNATLKRTQNAYVNAYNKMANAFDVLGLEESKEGYLWNFDNFFIQEANKACVSSWKTTVAYNYFRDDLDNLGARWNRNGAKTESGTDYFRPSQEVFSTFLSETGILIEMLEYCVKQFNSETDEEDKKNVYSNLAYFNETPINQCSYKPMVTTWTNGYGAVTDRREYYEIDTFLTDEAKKYRQKEALKYKLLEKSAEGVALANKTIAEAKERRAKHEKYWEEHADEKAKLDKEQADLKKKMDELNAQISAIDKKNTAKINELSKERDKKLQCEIEVDKQREVIRDLEMQRNKCGIFKGKEKKAIQARLDAEENPKLDSLRKKAEAEKKAHQDKFNAEINAVKGEGKDLRDEVAKLKKRSDEITKELTKDR